MSTSSTVPAEIDDAPYPLYPEQLPPAPRRAALTAEIRWQRRAALAAIFVGGVLAVTAPRVVPHVPDPLLHHGEGIFGTVIAKQVGTDLLGAPTHQVRYSYRVAKRQYHGEANVSAEEFAQLTESEGCLVTYLPDAPHVHCLGRPTHHEAELTDRFHWIGGGIATCGLLGLLIVHFASAGQLLLALYGTPVVGRVTAINRDDFDVKQPTALAFSYGFAGANGTVLHGRVHVPAHIAIHLYHEKPITILHDPSDERRHRPLCAFQRVRFTLGESES